VQIEPRYVGAQPIVVDGDLSAIAGPMIRQGRRFARSLGDLDAAGWAAQSRCAGWSNQDVVTHLIGTNNFWAMSINGGLAGTPTRFLEGFDPVATPAALVDAARLDGGEETLEAFAASSDQLIELVTSLDDSQWALPAEAPPGHMSIGAIAHHALWDSLIHERDVFLPIGITPPVEDDEVAAAAAYAAALNLGFGLLEGDRRAGVVALRSTSPPMRVAITGDAVTISRATAEHDDASEPVLELTGTPIEVLDALSVRSAHDPPIPPDLMWMVGALGRVFEVDSLER